MKKIFLMLVILLVATENLLSQGFVGKTNEINLNFKENPGITVSNLPSVSWTYPGNESTVSQQNKIDVEVFITSALPLASVKINVGSPSTGIRGTLNVKLTDIVNGKFKRTVHLENGQNQLEVVVENIQGGIISSKRMVTIGMDAIADALSIDRKDYALLFGTDKYENWNDLTNPVNDAQTIKGILESRFGFTTDMVQDPNQEDVWDKMVDYAQMKFKPQDQLFIFFAGHGYFDQTLNEGYAVARNSLLNDKGKSTYISYERLRSLVNNIPCEHIFLVMDVCFGGTFDPIVARNRGGDAAVNDKVYIARKLSYKTRRFLTSGGKEYVPDGRPGFHSPFAAKLILALKEGAGVDNILTIDEIKSYVERLTPEPRYGSFGDNNPASDFVFVVKQ